MTDGKLVQNMTESESMKPTPESNSDSLPNTLVIKTTQPTLPLEEITTRDGTVLVTTIDGPKFYKKKRRYGGRPTKFQSKEGNPSKYYNLVFVEGGKKVKRLYEIHFISFSNPDKTCSMTMASSSLRELVRGIPWMIGKMRCTSAVDEFVLRFKRVSSQPGFVEEKVPVNLLHERPPELRHTDPDVGTLILED